MTDFKSSDEHQPAEGISKVATEIRSTPLFAWHAANGGRMVEFAGYQMPIQYTSIVQEHAATRNAAGVFDISHMGRIRFEGNRAHELLDHLLTRRVADMRLGDVRYSFMCDEKGGILDDVLVSNLETPSSRQYFLLVVNASNLAKLVHWMTPHVKDFPDVAVNDVTESTAMIAVQGPRAAEVLNKLFNVDVSKLGYYKATVTDQMKKPCIISRTGYTGEDGFELIVRSEEAPRVWENVMLAGREIGISAVGLGARDTLRLEAGMPLYGHELSADIDPYSAGLGFAVNLNSSTGQPRHFLGSEALATLKAAPRKTKRVGLRLSGRRAAREGALLLDADGRRIGEVTSGTFSPTLQSPISMAYVAPEIAVVGNRVDVDIRGSKAAAEIVSLPFYKRSDT